MSQISSFSLRDSDSFCSSGGVSAPSMAEEEEEEEEEEDDEEEEEEEEEAEEEEEEVVAEVEIVSVTGATGKLRRIERLLRLVCCCSTRTAVANAPESSAVSVSLLTFESEPRSCSC